MTTAASAEAFTRLFKTLERHLPAGELRDDERLHPGRDGHGRLVVRTGARIYIVGGLRLGPRGVERLQDEAVAVLRVMPIRGGSLLFTEYRNGKSRRSATVPGWAAAGMGAEAN